MEPIDVDTGVAGSIPGTVESHAETSSAVTRQPRNSIHTASCMAMGIETASTARSVGASPNDPAVACVGSGVASSRCPTLHGATFSGDHIPALWADRLLGRTRRAPGAGQT